MIPLETPLGRIALLGSILLMVVGGLGVLVTVTALIGLALTDRFAWAAANPSLITLVVAAIVLGGGIMLYRRIER
jgi:hypothetical protein